MPETTSTASLGSGRYRIIREIARGGMATVFVAHDEVLDRRVAVKTLHPDRAADPAFIERFLREARAAAGVTHPNVVAIYDWGREDDAAYLVMEYVDGPSLRDVLVERRRLRPAEAVAVLAPAAAGIAAAHARGLVHRDVKPENLLISSSGAVKVTDFGLARAGAETTETFEAGAIVGSPHYLPPEVVRGEKVDARADVYSLGVVLYECLVGRPPFEADSPRATALRHTAETVPPPSTAGEVPDDLDEVVARATAPDPADRYPGAGAFERAIRTAVPAGEVPDADNNDRVHDTIIIPPEATETVVTPRDRDDDGRRPAPRPAKQRRARRWPRRVLLALLVAASLAGGLYGAWAMLIAPVTDVTDVRGRPAEQAVAILRGEGFAPVVSDDEVYSLEVAKDHVIDQDPMGTARAGSAITLTVSAGPAPTTVPEVEGVPRDGALAALEKAVLRADVVEDYSEKVKEGLVVDANPDPGTQILQGETVRLVVSKGRAPIKVPEVVGQRESAAATILAERGLRPVVAEEVFHDEAPAGTVVSQDPGPGAVLHRGDRVALVVSKGPKPVPMPDVRGRPRDEAVATLKGLGLVVGVREQDGFGFFVPSGTVAKQDPAPGRMVRRGEHVTIYVWS